DKDPQRLGEGYDTVGKDSQHVTVFGQNSAEVRENHNLVKATVCSKLGAEVGKEVEKGGAEVDLSVEVEVVALTQDDRWEVVGEKLSNNTDNFSAQQEEDREEGGSNGLGLGEKSSGGSPLMCVSNLGCGLDGLGPIGVENNQVDKKQKKVVIWEDEVDKRYVDILRGSCSNWAGLPIGLGQEKLSAENHLTKFLKDKGVAKLALEYELEVQQENTGRVTQGTGQRSNLLKGGGGHTKKAAGGFGGFTMCDRLVQAVQRGGRGKKGKRKKKGKTENKYEVEGSNDSISNDSTELEGVVGCQKSIQVSAIKVVLVEGESNVVCDLENRAYRIEAERLFNIGLNMGATSIVERISMVERLMDMEANDVTREKKKVRELIGRQRVELIALQETKLGEVDSKLCARLWGGDNVGWRNSIAIGRSGGLLTMWDINKGSLLSSFQGQGYLGVCLEWGVKKLRCVILNVYAPCSLNAKKTLWVDLLVAMRVYGADHYCILGDFNAVRSREERKGVRVGGEVVEDMRLFNIFIDNTGLIDLPLMGRKFTWMQPNGRCLSRLDRILVSQNWHMEWGNVSLWGLKRDVSDHSPILLKYDDHDWGPKPFRFNNFWLSNPSFRKVVSDAWGSFEVRGWKGYVVKEKMKLLKGSLKLWNKEVYGNIDKKIDDLTFAIEELEIKSESLGLSEEELVRVKMA
ncbi:reverse transcriptase, partial [Trifolium medium]|nr:reverse transcriptase [Trifolium medium]